MATFIATERDLIKGHFLHEWYDYPLSEVSITQITNAGQFTYGAQENEAQLGDWLIASDDGQAAEIVRIVDGAVQSIHSNP